MSKAMKIKKQIPNLLCLFRVAAAPVIMFMLLYDNYISKWFPFNNLNGTAFGKHMDQWFDTTNSHIILIAGFVFLAAIISDVFDGYYARKYDAVSDTGKWLDPLADKLLIIGTLIAFYILNYEPGTRRIMIWPLMIIIIRELVVTILRSYCAKKGTVIAAMLWGKLKTFSQTVALIFCFIFDYVHFPLVGQYMVCIAAAITFISLFPYLFMFYKTIFKSEGK